MELDSNYFAKPKVLIDKEEYDYLNDKIDSLQLVIEQQEKSIEHMKGIIGRYVKDYDQRLAKSQTSREG